MLHTEKIVCYAELNRGTICVCRAASERADGQRKVGRSERAVEGCVAADQRGAGADELAAGIEGGIVAAEVDRAGLRVDDAAVDEGDRSDSRRFQAAALAEGAAVVEGRRRAAVVDQRVVALASHTDWLLMRAPLCMNSESAFQFTRPDWLVKVEPLKNLLPPALICNTSPANSGSGAVTPGL